MGEIDRVFGGDIIDQPRERLVLVDLGQGAVARPVGRPRCAEEHPLAGVGDPQLRHGVEGQLEGVFLMARLAGVEVVGAGHHVVGGLVGVQIHIAVIALGRLADHFLAPGDAEPLGKLLRRLVIRQAVGGDTLARVARHAVPIADPAQAGGAVGPVAELLLDVGAARRRGEDALLAVDGQQVVGKIHALAAQFPHGGVLGKGIQAAEAQRVNGQVGAGIPLGKALFAEGDEPVVEHILGLGLHLAAGQSAVGKDLIGEQLARQQLAGVEHQGVVLAPEPHGVVARLIDPIAETQQTVGQLVLGLFGQNTAAAFAEGAQDVGVVDKVKIAAVETAADVVGLHGQQLFGLGGVAAGG